MKTRKVQTNNGGQFTDRFTSKENAPVELQAFCDHVNGSANEPNSAPRPALDQRASTEPEFAVSPAPLRPSCAI
ncbi:hypothetical protein NTGM5_490006 [Candidatus Nitrotoga sp. M5]|nr:hypothetical protein NTGM5_490006 [Candidatus Nitrotoga sp. M5]